MRIQTAVRLSCFLAALAGGIPCGAEEPKPCRVRFVKAATAEKVSFRIIQEVESWIAAGGRGCTLVSNVGEADLVLELVEHTYKIETDGTPRETWMFVARRLDEPDSSRAVHRFGLTAFGASENKDRVSQRLPVMLNEMLGRRARGPARAVDPI